MEEKPAQSSETRTFTQIARQDALTLFRAAEKTWTVSTFPFGKDARSYAVCGMTDRRGKKGAVVISTKGRATSDSRFTLSKIFKTNELAGRHVWTLLAAEWERYQEAIEADTSTAKPDSDQGSQRVDDSSIEDIAEWQAESLYREALGDGNVTKFDDEVEDTRAHACCAVENDIGCCGWAVISASGMSWEGISCELSGVFATHDAADNYIAQLLLDDEEEYEAQRAEEEEEEEEDEDACEDDEEAADEDEAKGKSEG